MIELVNANTLNIPLADKSVHMICTSPPYWGLRSYSGTAEWVGGDAGCDHVEKEGHKNTGLVGLRGATDKPGQNYIEGNYIQYRDTCAKCGAHRVDAQLGLERLHDCLGWATGEPCGECYVCHTVAWARECWRVLRDDGVMWLNLGDSYAGGGGYYPDSPSNQMGSLQSGGNQSGQRNIKGRNRGNLSGLKPKDLCLIPSRVALALQADGWYVRSNPPWLKRNTMPESCTDRPGTSHEDIFLLSKSARYFFDMEAVRVENRPASIERAQYGWNGVSIIDPDGKERRAQPDPTEKMGERWANPAGRNLRTIDFFAAACRAYLAGENPVVFGDEWPEAIICNTSGYSGAHFATWPPALVEIMIKAGTSEAGCCSECGAQWERDIKKEFVQMRPQVKVEQRDTRDKGWNYESGFSQESYYKTTTLGFRPSCQHNAPAIPCTVYDPFAGSGTTLLVARQLGRSAIGTDLSFEYLRDQARKRLSLDALDAWQAGAPVDGTAALDDLPLFGRNGRNEK